MNDGQFRSFSQNMASVKRLWFKWTMTAATTFTINWSKEFLAGTAGVVRTGTGVYDLFPEQPPGVALIGWWFGVIQATPAATTGGSAMTSVVNNLVASSKVTATFRRSDTFAAADLVTADIVYGYLDIQTVSV